MPDPRFRILGARTLSHTSFLRLDRIHLATDGHGAIQRETIRHPGAVAVVPVIEREQGDHVMLLRQYRAPIDQMLLELPAGKLDVPGEPKESAAFRELQEEAGLAAGSLEPLIGFHTGPGFHDEYITVFVARDCTVADVAPDGPEEEGSELVEIPVTELADAISSGAITDVKTQVGLMAFLHAEQFAQRSP